MELRVGGKYRLGRKIGSGSFGDIYLGVFLCVFSPLIRALLEHTKSSKVQDVEFPLIRVGHTDMNSPVNKC